MEARDKKEEVGTQAGETGAANPAGEQQTTTDKKMPHDVVYCPSN